MDIPSWLNVPPGFTLEPYGPRLSPKEAKRRAWIASLPKAEQVGACSVDSTKRTVYRIEGFDGPYAMAFTFETPIEGETPPLRDFIPARKDNGGYDVPRWYYPVQLSPEQLARFGFKQEGVTADRKDVASEPTD